MKINFDIFTLFFTSFLDMKSQGNVDEFIDSFQMNDVQKNPKKSKTPKHLSDVPRCLDILHDKANSASNTKANSASNPKADSDLKPKADSKPSKPSNPKADSKPSKPSNPSNPKSDKQKSKSKSKQKLKPEQTDTQVVVIPQEENDTKIPKNWRYTQQFSFPGQKPATSHGKPYIVMRKTSNGEQIASKTDESSTTDVSSVSETDDDYHSELASYQPSENHPLVQTDHAITKLKTQVQNLSNQVDDFAKDMFFFSEDVQVCREKSEEIDKMREQQDMIRKILDDSKNELRKLRKKRRLIEMGPIGLSADVRLHWNEIKRQVNIACEIDDLDMDLVIVRKLPTIRKLLKILFGEIQIGFLLGELTRKPNWQQFWITARSIDCALNNFDKGLITYEEEEQEQEEQ